METKSQSSNTRAERPEEDKRNPLLFISLFVLSILIILMSILMLGINIWLVPLLLALGAFVYYLLRFKRGLVGFWNIFLIFILYCIVIAFIIYFALPGGAA